MTFSYDLGDPDDVTRVRFHVGDVDAEAAIFSDEEIAYVVREEGSWQAGVIACLQSLIARLAADPKFTADWLTVERGEALAAYRKALREKRAEFGLPAVRATASGVYRADSLATAVSWSSGATAGEDLESAIARAMQRHLAQYDHDQIGSGGGDEDPMRDYKPGRIIRDGDVLYVPYSRNGEGDAWAILRMDKSVTPITLLWATGPSGYAAALTDVAGQTYAEWHAVTVY
jgi:hypothetical protein